MNHSPRVFTDFSKFIQKQSQTDRFKVHRPSCSCRKVQSFFKMCPRSDRDHGSNDVLTRSSFVIVPQTDCGDFDCVFVSAPVKDIDRDDNGLHCEKRLVQQELSFQLTPTASVETNADSAKIKMSCASCLLREEPNGFLCLSSSDKTMIDRCRDEARERTSQRMAGGIALHPDHADHLCALHKCILEEIGRGELTGFLQELKDQGVDLSPNGPNASNASTNSANPRIILGHHLETVLDIPNGSVGEYILVTITQTTSLFNEFELCYKIDITGGKRQLGESSLECTIRETEEECSLDIDEAWLIDRGVRGEGIRGQSNIFFMLDPADVSMGDGRVGKRRRLG